MKDNLKIVATIALILAAIGGGAWWEISLWGECRQTNTFFYCVRVLGK